MTEMFVCKKQKEQKQIGAVADLARQFRQKATSIVERKMGREVFLMRVMVVLKEEREGWRRAGRRVVGASLVAHEFHEALGGEGLWPLDGQAKSAVPDE